MFSFQCTCIDEYVALLRPISYKMHVDSVIYFIISLLMRCTNARYTLSQQRCEMRPEIEIAGTVQVLCFVYHLICCSQLRSTLAHRRLTPVIVTHTKTLFVSNKELCLSIYCLLLIKITFGQRISYFERTDRNASTYTTNQYLHTLKYIQQPR